MGKQILLQLQENLDRIRESEAEIERLEKYVSKLDVYLDFEKSVVSIQSLKESEIEIEGKIDYSVLFSDVTVEEGAAVHYSIVMPGAVVKKGAVVQYSIVAENAVIEEGAVVGENPEKVENLDEWGVSVIGSGITIGKDAKVKAKVTVAERAAKPSLAVAAVNVRTLPS